MGTHSKQKGSRFERSVCVALSRWCSDDLRDDLFWRSAMSGGRATMASRRGRKLAASAGDITAIDPLGAPMIDAFFIECKHYKDLEVSGWVYGNTTPLDEVWDKPYAQAQSYGKQPLIIAKQDRKPELVLTTREGWRWIYAAAHSHVPLCATIYRNEVAVPVFYFQDLIVKVQYQALKREIALGGRERL